MSHKFLMKRIEYPIGRQFGLLTIIEKFKKDNRIHYKCSCECGGEKITYSHNLRHSKSCGCIRKKKWDKIDLSEHRARIFRQVLYAYKRSAKLKNHKFLLSREEFIGLVEGNCFYCGDPPKNLTKYTNNKEVKLLLNGVDRIDNLGGYTIDNCVSCCRICNRKKSNMSYDEFIGWIGKVYKNTIGKRK